MKQKIALFLAAGFLTLGATAQKNNFLSDKKPSSFGIHFNAIDFVTPLTLESSATSRKFANFSDLDYGFSVSYWKGLTNTIDFSLRAGAIFSDFAAKRGQQTYNTEWGLELEPTLNFRPYKDAHRFAPFLTAGVGAGYYTGEFAPYVPTGVGLQFNFNSISYLLLQAQYRWSLDKKNIANNMFYSLGVLHSLAKDAPVVVEPVVPVIADRDGDGVPDSEDLCPDTPGLASLQGCPDRDGDGIADKDDKCPDVAGIAKYQGCPIPDTDGDGINDEMDKCPTVPGVAKYQGCPIPDTDGDGVNDEMDKCPTRPGPASNQGCPVIDTKVIEKINYAAKNVYFSTASYKLLPKSFPALNEVVKVMKEDESLMLDIEGHTDSQGADDYNQTLSENRAKSVLDYLVSKGISADRLTSKGYGESRPVATNETAAGRAKNRRTEMTVRNF